MHFSIDHYSIREAQSIYIELSAATYGAPGKPAVRNIPFTGPLKILEPISNVEYEWLQYEGTPAWTKTIYIYDTKKKVC